MHPSDKHLLSYGLILLIGLMLAACGVTGGAGPEANAPVLDVPGSDIPAEGDSDPEPAGEAQTPVNINCTETNPHPIGQSISQTFDVDYEEVMTWFCSGYTFDDILIALETSEATGVGAGTLLEMSEEQSWEDIWNEVGFEG